MSTKKNHGDSRGRGVRLFARLCAAALALVATSCRRGAEEIAVPETSPRVVRVFVVSDDHSRAERTFPVFLKSASASKLSFRTAGRIEELNVDVGDRVDAGAVVARLDSRDYQLIADRAKQAILEAQAALKAMETGARPEDVDSASAALSAASSQRETAEKQYARVESLNKDGAASDMQLDLAKTALDAAKAAERAAEKTLEKAKKGSRDEEIEMIKAKIDGLEIDLQLAENKLSDVTLTAPFSGLVSEKYVENHESVAPGAPIVTLVDDRAFEGELNAPEEIPLHSDEIESIECVFDSIPNRAFSATLKRSSTAPQKGNRSYLTAISVDVTPEDGALVGMVGVAKIRFKTTDAVATIPTASLIRGDGAESAVWVVDPKSGAVSKRVVEVGDFDGEKVAIRSGLTAGDQIVAAGARFLTDGQVVSIENENANETATK